MRQAVNRLEDVGYVTYDDGLTVVDERVRDADRELVAASTGVSPPSIEEAYDFAIEHPGGRRAILEIVGFWTPEYLDAKLAKIREVEATYFILAVSERLDCASEDFGQPADRVLWFKTGIHVYDLVELAESFAGDSQEAGWQFRGLIHQ